MKTKAIVIKKEKNRAAAAKLLAKVGGGVPPYPLSTTGLFDEQQLNIDQLVPNDGQGRLHGTVLHCCISVLPPKTLVVEKEERKR